MLNEEEIKFVEDPANADLFDDPPSSKNKRTRDDYPSPDNPVAPAKRAKPSGDEEVSWFKLTLLSRGVLTPAQFISTDG